MFGIKKQHRRRYQIMQTILHQYKHYVISGIGKYQIG